MAGVRTAMQGECAQVVVGEPLAVAGCPEVEWSEEERSPEAGPTKCGAGPCCSREEGASSRRATGWQCQEVQYGKGCCCPRLWQRGLELRYLSWEPGRRTSGGT